MAATDLQGLASKSIDEIEKEYVKNVAQNFKDHMRLDISPSVHTSALGLACQLGDIQIVSSLLDKGEDVNAKGKVGKCPIHILCCHTKNQHVRVMILELLLRYDVKVDEQDDFGRTALHYACYSNQVPLVELLIQAGCNVGLQDCDGDTPFTTACRLASETWYFWNSDCLNDQDQFQPQDFPPYCICRNLLKAGADPKQATLLPSAVMFSTMDIVSECLDLSMDVNMLDENRRSPLVCACSSPCIPPSMVELLLKNGADANQEGGGRKNKPIIVAYLYNSVDKMHLLLSYGATVSNEEMSEIVSISLSKYFLENPEVINEDSKELATWKLLLKAGFRPQLDMIMMKMKRVSLCNSYAQASPWIFSHLLCPVSSLKDICRVCIRSQLSPSIDDKTDSLPIPNSLKDFLKFL